MTRLQYENIEALPLIHGRLAFAIEARRQLLEHRYDAVAVELPRSLQPSVTEAVAELPTASIVVYRESFSLQNEETPQAYYVPVLPADGVIEALRVAGGERVPVYFIDAEVEGFDAPTVHLPDPHAVHGLGLGPYYEACEPFVQLQRRSESDDLRESHMAARLRDLQFHHSGRILFLCGMAHWRGILRHLEHASGRLHDADGIPPEWIQRQKLAPSSIPFVTGELPFVVERYETYRSGFEIDDFESVQALKDLLLEARREFDERFPGSLERPDPQALRTVLNYARKLTVRRKQLIPDSYQLVVATNGVVGNDFALMVLEVANRYRFNGVWRLTNPESGEQPQAAEEAAPDEAVPDEFGMGGPG